jgi:hypothetical protein
MEIVHVDVCSSWCEVERGVFYISSNDVWYIYLIRNKYKMIEIFQFMKWKLLQQKTFEVL